MLRDLCVGFVRFVQKVVTAPEDYSLRAKSPLMFRYDSIQHEVAFFHVLERLRRYIEFVAKQILKITIDDEGDNKNSSQIALLATCLKDQLINPRLVKMFCVCFRGIENVIEDDASQNALS